MKKVLFFAWLIIIFLSINTTVLNAEGSRSVGFRVTPRNVDELNQAIELRKQSFLKERAGMEENKSRIYENQNKLRSGVQNLMIMENMIGKNGLEVARIAGDLNMSLDDTLRFERDFSERSKVKKFFFGQKKKVVDGFSNEINNREEKILKLKELLENSEVSSDIKNILQEQLTNIEDEQNRLGDYFQNEIKRKGILTWLVNIFN